MPRQATGGVLKMRDLFEFAEFLASSWRLANGDNRMPTSHGILDRALYELLSEMPEKYRKSLSFGNTRVGFRCYELADILYCAQANQLTSEPNPNYLTTAIQVTEGTERRIIRRHKVNPDIARKFGARLKLLTDKAKENENAAA